MNKKFSYENSVITKKQLKQIVLWVFNNYGKLVASRLVDDLKSLGFKYATRAGLSLNVEDLKIPPQRKRILKKTNLLINNFEEQIFRAELSDVERFQRAISTWNQTSEDLKNQIIYHFQSTDPLNPIFIMAFSGARGNLSQVRQLVGMRGLMADSSGEIISFPIIKNFREGLKVTDYLISSFGARKGLVDTALKTADSGYLTRRLVDVVQDVVIRELTCNTRRGLSFEIKTLNDFGLNFLGKVLSENFCVNNKILYKKGTILDFETIDILKQYIPFKIYCYSVLTCESTKSVCRKCYGWDLATNKKIRLGEAIGIIAAQSIGEPGTQLTMRTFHTGGVFTGSFSKKIRVLQSGQIIFAKKFKPIPFRTTLGQPAYFVQNKDEFFLRPYGTKKLYSVTVFPGSILFAKNKSFISKNEIIGEVFQKKKDNVLITRTLKSINSGEVFFDKKYYVNKKERKKSKIKISTLNKESGKMWIFDGHVSQFPPRIKFDIIPKPKRILKNQSLVSWELINYLAFGSHIQPVKVKPFKFSSYLILAGIKLKKFRLEDLNADTYFILFFDLKIPLKNFFTLKYGVQNDNIVEFLGARKLYVNYNCFKKVLEFNYNKFFKKQNKKIGKIVIFENETILTNLKNILNNKLNSNKKNNTYIIVEVFNEKSQKVKQFSFEFSIKKLLKLLYLNNKIFFEGEMFFQSYNFEKPKKLEIFLLPRTQGKNFSLIIVIKTLNFYQIPVFQLKIKKINTILTLEDYEQNITIPNNNNELSYFNFKLLPLIKNKIFFPARKNYLGFTLNRNKIQIVFIQEEHLGTSKNKKFINLQEKRFIKSYYLTKDYNFIPFGSLIRLQSWSSKISQKILNWKVNYFEKSQLFIFLLTNNDFIKIFTDRDNFTKKAGDFILKGDFITPNLKIQNSGLINKIDGNCLILRKAQPYLFSKGTFLFVSTGDYVPLKKKLGLVLLEKTVTGDIVQGLPKVEQILEARQGFESGRLIHNPGILYEQFAYRIRIKNAEQDEKFTTALSAVFLTKSGFEYYNRLRNQIQNCKIGNFLNINFSIREGINLHGLLFNYYKYFSKITSLYQSSYRSLKKIQFLIIDAVQEVYKSQGVSIADKHIELIVRQMTSKVKICNPGRTSLRCNEVLDLEYANLINSSLTFFDLKNEKNATIVYIPMLHGISIAARKTESFISAASFQETRKVLLEAAIQGKTDWLYGLKENVIIGHIIPAGTGKAVYRNLVHLKEFPLPFRIFEDEYLRSENL